MVRMWARTRTVIPNAPTPWHATDSTISLYATRSHAPRPTASPMRRPLPVCSAVRGTGPAVPLPLVRPAADGHAWSGQRDDPYEHKLSALHDSAGESRQVPVLRETAHRWLDKALVVAHSHLVRWDPVIEFFGLPNEAHLGFMLSSGSGEHGELIFQQPDTWALRWSAPPEVVCESWSLRVEDLEAGNDNTVDGYLRSPDRRVRCRRATDLGRFADSWAGKERRQGRGRRAVDHHA